MQQLSTLWYCNVSWFLVPVVIILLGGCDPTITPIQENDLHYSIFGYLNASADTQFVRIEKLRDGMPSDTPAELNAEVKLTNLSTGQEAILKDSLFYYLQRKAHNYYTSMEIEPTHTYRLEVNEGDASSSAEVVIPAKFSEPRIVEATPGSATLEIPEMERLIAVNAVYYSHLDCQRELEDCPENPEVRKVSFEHLSDTAHVINGDIQANVNHNSNLRKIATRYSGRSYSVIKVEVIIAAGNPGWPDFLSLDSETAALPSVTSNITGGTGLLGGIVSDTVVVPIPGETQKLRFEPGIVTDTVVIPQNAN